MDGGGESTVATFGRPARRPKAARREMLQMTFLANSFPAREIKAASAQSYSSMDDGDWPDFIAVYTSTRICGVN
jgi:hypothetical protein